ncbi:MAG: 3-phosphoshikimate 1-carboxyvinyltransferase [Corynebacteriales bacterium]|nr:3-phosphoshikimate 1-carboxyvinyltransferase [Mycobacteriales bacterium]
MTSAASALWPAPQADQPIRATVNLPGSKSATNRALILASAAEPGQKSLLRAPLRARDTELMASALRALGVTVADQGQDWLVTPGDMPSSAHIDCGLAGTVMRFVPPLAALASGDITFDGDPHARLRPMKTLLEGLRHLGANVSGDALPFVIHGTGAVRGGEIHLDASGSSQFVSALLLLGARFEDGVIVRHLGGPLPSAPHIEMTMEMLRQVGVDVTQPRRRSWQVAPGAIAPHDWNIEPDLSNAAPFLCAALVTGGQVHIPDWPHETTQAGDALRHLLPQLGATVSWNPSGLTVHGGKTIAGIDVDLHDVGELTPVLAALCALADHPSRLRGIGHLRNHETDRLAALATELNKLGAQVTEGADELAITPKPLRGGVFGTYDDHRMGQAGALLGLAVPGVEVENIATTGKTMTNFVELWTSMLESQ